MKSRLLKGLLALIMVFSIASCANGRQKPLTENNGSPANSPAESSSSAQSSSALPQNDLFSVVLASGESDMTGVWYYGNQPYARYHNGGIEPDMSISSELLSCREQAGGLYDDEQSEFVRAFAQALSGVAVDPESKTLMYEDYPIPQTGDYDGFWLSIGEWQPILYIFSTGDLYVEMNSQQDKNAYHYKLENASDYGDLVNKLSEIEQRIYSMPVDFSFTFGTSTELIKPESEAAKLYMQNDGLRAVKYSPRFTVERNVDGSWRTLEEIEPTSGTPETRQVQPKEFARFGIDLTNLKDAQKPGRYRVSNVFSYAGEEGITMYTEFEISDDATEIGYPIPPEMTPENQQYCERYVQMWGFYNPFREDFSEGAYPKNYHTYHLYYILSGMEGIRDDDGAYGDIPADIVEGVISRHFSVTPEQIRSLSATKAQNPHECYDPQTNSYHFEGGYGGGSSTGIVTESSRDGELLTLTCRWYGMDDSFEFENVVTMRVGENKNDFFYLENRVTDDA